MKKIGYIYKYSPEEEKGILVHGNWHWSDKPILFVGKDCTKAVSTGQLVYFEFDGENASFIEPASVENFDRSFFSFAKNNQHFDNQRTINKVDSYRSVDEAVIVYENISDIIINTSKNEEHNLSFFDNRENPNEGCHLDSFTKDACSLTDLTSLPDSIEELFACFGKYKHPQHGRYHRNQEQRSVIINLMHFPFWADTKTINENFKLSEEQILYYYNLFVGRKSYDYHHFPHTTINPPKSWEYLLSRNSTEELRSLINKLPELQPLFPIDFCMKNLDVLTIEHPVPNREVCHKLFQYSIAHSNSIKQYEDLKTIFLKNYFFEKTNDSGYCVKLNNLDPQVVQSLMAELENQFNTVITSGVYEKLKEVSLDKTGLQSYKLCKEETILLGHFFEMENNLSDIIFRYGYSSDFEEIHSIDVYLDAYKSLPYDIKTHLRPYVTKLIGHTILKKVRFEDITPGILGSMMEYLNNWIDENTWDTITKLASKKYAVLDDVVNLENAYEFKFITFRQCVKSSWDVISNCSIQKLIDAINDFGHHRLKIIQWFYISRVIDLFNFQDLSSGEKYKTTDCAISDVKDLIDWLTDLIRDNRIGENIYEKSITRILRNLSDEDRWLLFEQDYVSDPGVHVVKAKLREFYLNPYRLNEDLLKKACFQSMLVSDYYLTDDITIKLQIVNHLNAYHKQSVYPSTDGIVRLHLWLEKMSGAFDWDLVKNNFCYLSDEEQIKLIKYIFYLISKRKLNITINQLYHYFVETDNKANMTICFILYVLKNKQIDISWRISSVQLIELFGESEWVDLFGNINEFLYDCNGHTAISGINHEGWDIPVFNGEVYKIERCGRDFYSILIYSKTDNYCDDQETKSLVNTIKGVLQENFDVELVDDCFIIDSSQEFNIKQFVMQYKIEDKANLFKIHYDNDNSKLDFEPLYIKKLEPYTNRFNCGIPSYCQCGRFCGIDPNNGYPFFWCKKKVCVRRSHYIQPQEQWESYRLADLIYRSHEYDEYKAWSITSEISIFINKCKEEAKKDILDDEYKVLSSELNEKDEVGEWNDDCFTIFTPESDDEDVEYIEEYYEDPAEANFHESVTYNKYRGSYAQDEMGYSDDDIDTIFDGDPSAYWNID